MAIQTLRITQLRIIDAANCTLHAGVNIFTGKNASGKTSILEACALLATGKSFRTPAFDTVIQHGKDKASVVATIDKKTIGVARDKQKNIEIHIHGNAKASRAMLSEHIITQVITPKVADLIESSASIRRYFMDWGMFHVEPSSRRALQQTKKIIKQRNALLKNQQVSSEQELAIWNQQLAEAGETLSQMRTRHLTKVVEYFNHHYASLLGVEDIQVQYQQGWNKQKTLAEALNESLSQDLRFKTTKRGPHKADFLVSVAGRPAREVLSRGQLKLLSFLLRLSQVAWLYQNHGKKTVLLIDDINAELDKKSRAIVLGCLEKTGLQTLLTTVDPSQLEGLVKQGKMFHVEQGEIIEQ